MEHGTLTQTDWGGVERLSPQLLGGVMLTLLLLRPLTLMGLDDGVARNLGLALSLARLAALSLAIVISALLVNAVGIIGFIGLFAAAGKNAGGAASAATTDAGVVDWCADPLAFQSNHPLADSRVEGRSTGRSLRRIAAAAAAAAFTQH